MTRLDPDSMKRRGASWGSSEKRGSADIICHFFVHFTLEKDKFSDKKGDARLLKVLKFLLYVLGLYIYFKVHWIIVIILLVMDMVSVSMMDMEQFANVNQVNVTSPD